MSGIYDKVQKAIEDWMLANDVNLPRLNDEEPVSDTASEEESDK